MLSGRAVPAHARPRRGASPAAGLAQHIRRPVQQSWQQRPSGHPGCRSRAAPKRPGLCSPYPTIHRASYVADPTASSLRLNPHPSVQPLLRFVYGLLQHRLLAFDTDADQRAADELLLSCVCERAACSLPPSNSSNLLVNASAPNADPCTRPCSRRRCTQRCQRTTRSTS